MSSTENNTEAISSPEQQQTAPQPTEETMPLNEFTSGPPLHHHPYDGLDDEFDEDWLLARPSGFTSKLPNNDGWPVTERLVFPLQGPLPAGVQVDIQAPRTAFVCGVNGLVGRSLVPILVQRGCTRVIAFDIVEVPEEVKALHASILGESNPIEYVCGSIDNAALLSPLLKDDIDVIFNVTPVNPITLLKIAEDVGVAKFIHVSTPSTRIDPEVEDVINATEQNLSPLCSFEYEHDSIEQRAQYEKIVQEHNSGKMMTVIISPALVYGPNDDSFLNSLLDSAISNNLRIVGNGENKVSICHVENVCNALLLAANKLQDYEVRPAGELYLVSDDYDHYFWGLIDDLVIRGGLSSVKTHIKAPGILARGLGFIVSKIDPKSRMNTHNVRLLQSTRTFNISAAKTDLGYANAIDFEPAWLKVCESLLTRHNLPFYHTRFYYEGVQFQGFRTEVKKVHQHEVEERAAIAAQHAAERAAAQKRIDAEEAEKRHLTPAAEPEQAPTADVKPAAVVVAPVVVEATPVVEEVAPAVQEEVVAVPVVQEEVIAPVVEQEEVAPVVQEEVAPVVQEEVEVAPVVQEEVEVAPVVQEEEVAPVVQEEEEVAQEEEEVAQEEVQQSSKKGKKGKKH